MAVIVDLISSVYIMHSDFGGYNIKAFDVVDLKFGLIDI
jgi:hypothetical protein